MTEEKIREVKERLNRRYREYIDEGYSPNFSTRQTRIEIISELKDEGLRSNEAVWLIQEARELKNEK